MQSITYKDLEEVRHKYNIILSVDKQIQAEYYVYSSPSFSNEPRIHKNRSEINPTARALEQIDSLREKQKTLINDLRDFFQRLIAFVDDPEIVPIINMRFILGYAWDQIDGILKRDKWYSARKISAWLKSINDPVLIPGYDWDRKEWSFKNKGLA